jgi:hypothetical protein
MNEPRSVPRKRSPPPPRRWVSALALGSCVALAAGLGLIFSGCLPEPSCFETATCPADPDQGEGGQDARLDAANDRALAPSDVGRADAIDGAGPATSDSSPGAEDSGLLDTGGAVSEGGPFVPDGATAVPTDALDGSSLTRDADAAALDAGEVCVGSGRRCRSGGPEQCQSGVWRALPACPSLAPFCSDGACLTCQPGTPRCTGANLEVCDTLGNWTLQTTCGASTPICNVQTASCVGTRLVGGFSTVGAPAVPTGGVRVLQGELLIMPRACNSTMSACFRGGFGQ